MAFKKGEMKEAIQTVWKSLVEGDSDENIMDFMGIEPEDYESVRKVMLEEQAQLLRTKPPEHHYVEYMLWQYKGIKDLTEIVARLKEAKSPNAAAQVAAIKVRSDIYDKIISKGQEFGVLKKTPETKVTVGGHFVAELTSEKLRSQLTSALVDLDKLMKRYGDGDMTSVDPGPLHHGPKLAADSSLDSPAIVVVAPPAKDDMINVVAKPKPIGPRSDLKGKSYKSKKPPMGAKVRGVKSAAIKDEVRASKAVSYDRDFD